MRLIQTEQRLSGARREADAYPFIVADGKPYHRTLRISPD